MRIIISSHADQRIEQRIADCFPGTARSWVQEQVKRGRLACTSPAWHGRKRIQGSARRFVRTKLGSRGVLIVVERIAREVLRIVTVILEDIASSSLPQNVHGRCLTPDHIGRPARGIYPPATAPLMTKATRNALV